MNWCPMKIVHIHSFIYSTIKTDDAQKSNWMKWFHRNRLTETHSIWFSFFLLQFVYSFVYFVHSLFIFTFVSGNFRFFFFRLFHKVYCLFFVTFISFVVNFSPEIHWTHTWFDKMSLCPNNCSAIQALNAHTLHSPISIRKPKKNSIYFASNRYCSCVSRRPFWIFFYFAFQACLVRVIQICQPPCVHAYICISMDVCTSAWYIYVCLCACWYCLFSNASTLEWDVEWVVFFPTFVDFIAVSCECAENVAKLILIIELSFI